MGFFKKIGKAVKKGVKGVGKIAKGGLKTAVGVATMDTDKIKEGLKTTWDGVKDVSYRAPLQGLSAFGKKGGALIGGIGGFMLGGPLGAMAGAYLGSKIGQMARNYDESHNQIDQGSIESYPYDQYNPYNQINPYTQFNSYDSGIYNNIPQTFDYGMANVNPYAGNTLVNYNSSIFNMAGQNPMGQYFNITNANSNLFIANPTQLNPIYQQSSLYSRALFNVGLN